MNLTKDLLGKYFSFNYRNDEAKDKIQNEGCKQAKSNENAPKKPVELNPKSTTIKTLNELGQSHHISRDAQDKACCLIY